MKASKKMKTTTKLGIGVGVLAVLSPIGLVLPEAFKAGSAWGEWGTGEIANMLGYIPQGLDKLSSLWTSIFPDYSFHGWESKGLANQSFAYIVSAIVGIALCVALGWLFGKLLSRKKTSGKKSDGSHGDQ